MLDFLFGSTMILVMAGSLAMMYAIRRHRRWKKFTKWAVFACALMAGSAAALTFLGQWAGAAATGLLAVLGAPGGAIGVLALFFVIGLIADLLDGEPDGFARTAALVAPTLLAVTGGDLGMWGDQATGAVSDAGAALMASLIGL